MKESLGPTISSASSMGSVSPVMGGFSSFGVELGPSIGLGSSFVNEQALSIGNEGPVAPSFLENSIPLQIGRSPAIEVIRNPFLDEVVPETLTPPAFEFRADDVIAEVETIIGMPKEAPMIAPIYVPFEPIPRVANMVQAPVRPMIFPIIMPEIEEEVFPKAEPMLEPNDIIFPTEKVMVELTPVAAPSFQVYARSTSEVEQGVEQVSEEEDELILRNVVDQQAMRVREQEFSVAIEEVTEEDGQVDGSKVVAALPEENEEDRSEVLKETDPYRELPDGSWVEIKEEFASKKFTTKKDAKMGAWYLIQKKRAVGQKRKEGIPIEKQEIVRVHKYHHFVPSEATRIRMVKKGVVAEEMVQIKEPDLNPSLIGLFKAA